MARLCRDTTVEALRAAADEALTSQALPKRYAHGLAGNGALLWSVAFDSHKHVAIGLARLP